MAFFGGCGLLLFFVLAAVIRRLGEVDDFVSLPSMITN
jgi:hypothetical protein